MSWIDREVKRRVKAAQDSHQPSRPSESSSEPGQMQALWDMLQANNDNLPGEIRLKALADPASTALPGLPRFIAWLQAPNGAGLGFTGDAVRYTWPERSRHASFNFWIRWAPDQGYMLSRRVKSSSSVPTMAETRFNLERTEYIVKCLVVGTRVTAHSIAKRRFWIF